MAQAAREQLFSVLFSKQDAGAVAQVQQLLCDQPAIAAMAGGDGRLPLHVAMARQPAANALAMLPALLAAHPQAAQTPDRTGALPLHHAAKHLGGAMAGDAIHALVTAFPETALQGNDDGSRPLHIAAQWQGGNKGRTVVEALLKLQPTAAQLADWKGCTPLHIAARHQDDWAVVECILHAAPEMASVKDNKGWLPLHHLAGRQDARNHEHDPHHQQLITDMIAALVKAAPDALDKQTVDGRLPLHCACHAGNSAAVRALLGLAPQHLNAATKDGSTPLRLALEQSRSGPHTVLLLLKLFPEAALHCSNHGLLPLHFACSSACSKKVITSVVQAAPQALVQLSADGQAPLHMFVGDDSIASEVAFVALVDAAPHVLLVSDERDRWPLPIEHCQMYASATSICLQGIARATSSLVWGTGKKARQEREDHGILFRAHGPPFLFFFGLLQAWPVFDHVLAADFRRRIFSLLLAIYKGNAVKKTDGEKAVKEKECRGQRGAKLVTAVFLRQLLHVIRRVFLRATFDSSISWGCQDPVED